MRSVRHHGLSAFFAVVGLVAAGCGSPETTGGGGAGGQSASSASTGLAPVAACAKDPRVAVYAVGVEAKSTDGALTVRFLSASPSPPVKGNNTWVVQLLDGQGQPVNGATIATKSFMPDHGHGSSIKPKATAKGADGTYEITPVNLFMPGVWQITFAVTGPMTDSAVVTFCVEG